MYNILVLQSGHRQGGDCKVEQVQRKQDFASHATYLAYSYFKPSDNHLVHYILTIYVHVCSKLTLPKARLMERMQDF